MSVNAVGWFEIYVNDMNRAKAFYEKVFTQELAPLHNATDSDLEMWSFVGEMNQYGAPGALVKMEGCKAGGANVIVYFSCQDCSVEESRAVEAGGKVFKSKFSIGEYGHIALIEDTEGNMIGLHSLQ
ncbi:MAG: VOC family protein [Bdellovibrionales bacterium]|nr:VOC family protein [Bdellovibrionales bacterium]